MSRARRETVATQGMLYAEILASEDANRNKIILYKEGMFLKAYEHSAFLCHTHVHHFKLMRRFIVSVNRWVISVAFPENTAKKWFYAYPFRQVSEKMFVCDIDIPIDEVEYQNWTELARVETSAADRYTPSTSVIENTNVWKTAYDLMNQLLDVTPNLSKNIREPLATDAKALMFSICLKIKKFFSVSNPVEHLTETIEMCNDFASYIQLFRDRKEISLEFYALASERIVSVSKQLEALRRKAMAKVSGE